LLKDARKALGVNQKDVAKAIGRSQSAISKIEKSNRYLDVEEFLDLAVALGRDPWKVLQQAMREAPPTLPKPLKPRSKSAAKRRAHTPTKTK
jgi:transcriptional regulator with XRE-family HTH domain